MDKTFPTVSVIIPAANAAGTLPTALESIAAQDYPNVIEVVVAAADPETAASAEAGGARVVANPTGSTPAGLNLAIAATTGEVIVRCDAHSSLPPDYVSRATTTMQRTGADNVGGMQVPVGETLWERAIAAAMVSPLGAGDARHRVGGEQGPAETVYLGVFRRSTLEKLGGFDEAFARNQDYELNHRIIESGGTVWFDPDLKVAYRPRGSLSALARQYYQYGRAKRLFDRRHPGSLRLRQLAPPTLVLVLAGAVVASVWWPIALVIPIAYLVTPVVHSLFRPGPTWSTTAALVTMHLSWGWGFLRG